MRQKLFCISLCAVLFTFFGIGTAFSALVGIRDTATDATEIWVEPCTFFEVELFLELSGAESTSIASNGITGFTVDIIWDELVGLVSFTKGSGYESMTGGNPTPNLPNDEWTGAKLELAGYTPTAGSNITQSHVMGTFNLHCLNPGDTTLVPEGHFSNPDTNWGLADNTSWLEDVLSPGSGVSGVTYEGITIHQTPLPPAILLFGSGLIGIFGVRRKIKKKS
jgi:hypothetical protein